MTRAPYVMLKPEGPFERGGHELVDTHARLALREPAPRRGLPGDLAGRDRRVRRRRVEGVSRERQDAFALESQRRAAAAIEAGRFDGQIVPVPGPAAEGRPGPRGARRAPPAGHDGRGPREAEARVPRGRHRHGRQRLRDQRRRRRRAAGRGRPRPGARASGRWPASWRPRSPASIPRVMGIGPVPAIRKALERAGLAVGRPRRRRAQRGVRVAVGRLHRRARASTRRSSTRTAAPSPWGIRSGRRGARLVTMLVHELERTGGRYGLASMCIGVGQGIATVVERVDG